MKKIKINFQYCYGIKKLEKEFDFSNSTFTIYAPNGSMKTSFAKTFYDYANDRETPDLAFPERKTVREILVDEKKIASENIFVIEPYNADYQSEKISTLLANKELKSDYEAIHKDIDKTKIALIKKLKQLSGLTGRKDNIEDVIEDIFGKSFFDFVIDNEIEKVILNNDSLPFHDVQYQIIFNDKVIAFLNTKDFKTSIKDYIEKYHELIEQSPYLNREFNFYHAENIQKQLATNNFFKAGHSVNLFDGKTKNEYSSEEELKEILENEKKKVLNNEELQKSFEEINKKLMNAELRTFRDYLLENRDILPELVNLEEFKKKIWLAYFVNQKELFLELAKKYKNGQEKIKELIEQAKKKKLHGRM